MSSLQDAVPAAMTTVFVLQDLDDQVEHLAKRLIERAGFDVIDVIHAPFPAGDYALINGARGTPTGLIAEAQTVAMLVAVDLCPWSDLSGMRGADARIDNARVCRLDEMNELISPAADPGSAPATGRAIAATSNATSAWKLLDAVVRERVEGYRQEIASRLQRMTPPFPVVEDITDHGNNARTYVVRYAGREAVCKVFRPGRERQLRNERDGLALSQKIPAIPRCLEASDNWLVMELAQGAQPLDAFRSRLGLIPLQHARKAFEILRAIHDAGYAHLDFRPHHVLVEPGGELRVIDFDRMHRYEPLPAFEDGLSIAGFDDRMVIDGPNGPAPTYARVWEPCVGLTFASLQHDSVPLQHVKRFRVMVTRAIRGIVRRMTAGAMSFAPVMPENVSAGVC